MTTRGIGDQAIVFGVSGAVVGGPRAAADVIVMCDPVDHNGRPQDYKGEEDVGKTVSC